jgi:hypothetical protein
MSDWQNLRNISEPSRDRVKAQADWASRREAHFDNPNPNPYEAIRRKLGNMLSNWSLERQERRDMDWEHHPQDMAEGGYVFNSPIDQARFDVYNRILKARQQGAPVSESDKRAWQAIKRGDIPGL